MLSTYHTTSYKAQSDKRDKGDRDGMKFIVDHNVGKLTKWLRMMGYDTLFFDGEDDWQMVRTALAEGRVILTRDTQIMRYGW